MGALYRPLNLRKPQSFSPLETLSSLNMPQTHFLLKISYINQMADLCEALGANVHDVAKVWGLMAALAQSFFIRARVMAAHASLKTRLLW